MSCNVNTLRTYPGTDNPYLWHEMGSIVGAFTNPGGLAFFIDSSIKIEKHVPVFYLQIKSLARFLKARI